MTGWVNQGRALKLHLPFHGLWGHIFAPPPGCSAAPRRPKRCSSAPHRQLLLNIWPKPSHVVVLPPVSCPGHSVRAKHRSRWSFASRGPEWWRGTAAMGGRKWATFASTSNALLLVPTRHCTSRGRRISAVASSRALTLGERS